LASRAKAAHVGPDLGEDDLGGPPPDARDGDEPLDQLVRGTKTRLDLGIEQLADSFCIRARLPYGTDRP